MMNEAEVKSEKIVKWRFLSMEGKKQAKVKN